MVSSFPFSPLLFPLNDVSIFFRLFCKAAVVSYVSFEMLRWKFEESWSPRAFPTFDRCVPPIILFSWVIKMFLSFPLLFHRYRNMQMPQLVQHKLVAQSSLYDSRFPIRSHISIHNKKHGVDLLSAVSNPRFHHCILRGKQHESSQRKKRAWSSQSICRRKWLELSFVWIQRTGSFHGTVWLYGGSGVSFSGSYCT